MTTLLGDELFEYLTHLENEVSKRLSTSTNKSLQHLMYSQMKDLFASEIKFLQYINSNGTEPMLSISPNGLPSVESLNPDLEKMCELEDFEDIKQRYQKSIDPNEKKLYVSVSEEEWNNELKNRKKETLPSKIDFAINETIDGKFELTLRENVYRKGYDQYSKEHPILVREGKMQYHIIWGRLIENSEESFYVPDTALILRKKSEVSAKPKEKIIDGTVIKRMGKKGLAGLASTASIPFIVPTSCRKYVKEDINPEGIISILSCLGNAIAIPACLIAGSTGGNLYAIAVGAGLFATNLGSGLYEWYRYEKNKGDQ